MQRWLLRWGWLLPVGALLIGATVLAVTYAFASIPLPEDIELESSAEVYDRHGRLIGTYSDEVRRFLLNDEELDRLRKKKPYVGRAVVAAEDRDFYEHNGISIRGIFRAGWANLTGGEIQQGGSTITQQYIKNAVLQDPERTITRKAKEAILAIKLERRYGKEEILGFYLNTIYLGRGAYGIEAASRTYFDKHAEELTLSEAAYLAGIIPAPESYQPDENPEGARLRRDRVLDLMVRQGYISQVRADLAKRQKVKLAPGAAGRIKRQRAAYFMEWLRKEYLYPEYGECLFTCGLKIYTTLDLDMQALAEEAVDEHLADPEDPPAALVSVTPTGEVRAMVGGRDHTSVKKARGFNYATDGVGREAGSTFKPFTLLTAIEEGVSPVSRFSGASPVTLEECGVPGDPYQPENYGGSSYGTLTLDQATTNSVNTVYAQLIAQIGPEKVAALLEKMDFGKDVPSNCSLALGSWDVTPLQMARGYAAFAARGAEPEIMPIRYVVDSNGVCRKEYRPTKEVKGCLEEAKLKTVQAAEQNSADVLNQVLTNVVEGGTATGAGLPDGRPVAGKTGTSQDYKNAWFSGYVPQLVTTVWMGYPVERDEAGAFTPMMWACGAPPRCRPVNGLATVTGGSIPADIWRTFMAGAVAELPIETFPTPVDLPDEVINSPAPVPSPAPSPTDKKSPEPEPSEEPSASPTSEPSPTSQPSPTGADPTILPSPTTDPNDGSEGDP